MAGRSYSDTGWFKHISPNFLRVQCPRRFFERDPEFLHPSALHSLQVTIKTNLLAELKLLTFFWDERRGIIIGFFAVVTEPFTISLEIYIFARYLDFCIFRDVGSQGNPHFG